MRIITITHIYVLRINSVLGRPQTWNFYVLRTEYVVTCEHAKVTNPGAPTNMEFHRTQLRVPRQTFVKSLLLTNQQH